ncbi:MAG: DUF1214 domain-containing protein, partial [Verrucomicrobiales bacterium]
LARAEEQIRLRTPADPAAQAEGCRFVWRVFSALREFILEQDPRLPSFVPVMTPTRKFFADNPDTLYHRAPLHGDLSYRVSGQRGSCAYLSFCAYGQSPGGIEILGTLSDQDLSTDADGRFEIVISAERPDDAPNWIGIREGARSLVARQYFIDREAESPASYSIGLTHSSQSPAGGELDPQEFARRLLVCGQSLERAVGATLRATDGWSKEPNTISFDSDAGELADLFPTPDNHYVGGWFQLGSDEALVIDLSPPDCRYWNLHLMSRWLESLDGRGNPVSLNLAQAIPGGADGQMRFIVSATDPGRPNWLDTGGRREGCFALRWLQASTVPERPACRLVKLAEL